jgi:hypothetical protein
MEGMSRVEEENGRGNHSDLILFLVNRELGLMFFLFHSSYLKPFFLIFFSF